jgi:hypothetical protein
VVIFHAETEEYKKFGTANLNLMPAMLYIKKTELQII